MTLIMNVPADLCPSCLFSQDINHTWVVLNLWPLSDPIFFNRLKKAINPDSLSPRRDINFVVKIVFVNYVWGNTYEIAMFIGIWYNLIEAGPTKLALEAFNPDFFVINFLFIWAWINFFLWVIKIYRAVHLCNDLILIVNRLSEANNLSMARWYC